MPTSYYAFGEILLAALAFSDAGGAKRRPLLVIHDFGVDDLLVAAVTSHAPKGVCDVHLADWSASGLRLPSVVRMDKLPTVAKSCISPPVRQ
jgi:mRNA interferase MazF